MNTTTTDRLFAKTSALMLAVIVTVATLAGVDSIASTDQAATMAQTTNAPRS
jgi:outer membrane murein-binding lipoprotein Lpp